MLLQLLWLLLRLLGCIGPLATGVTTCVSWTVQLRSLSSHFFAETHGPAGTALTRDEALTLRVEMLTLVAAG